MHLQRVQVPNFRALKNIDITFEKERIPRIFPLASLNGGGKSTLLQLVFTLLTCSASPEKHEFLVNLLKDFEIDYESGYRTLARIELFDGDNSISLEFSCQNTCYLVDRYLENKEDEFVIILKDLGFTGCSENIRGLVLEIELLKSESQFLKRDVETLNREKDSKPKNIFQLPHLPGGSIAGMPFANLPEGEEGIQLRTYNSRLKQIESAMELKENELDKFLLAQKNKEEILDILRSDRKHYICSYQSEENHNEVNILCHIEDNNKNTDILQSISQKIFLAAPVSQVFLFFSRQDIDFLFGNRNNGENYEHIARQNQDRLPGFFLHDFSTIKILAEAFEKAKHNDWQQAIKTRGQYGNEYAKISKDLEYVFSGKIIEPLEDLSGIIIKTVENAKERILHPEDLSHGELRRLSFYAWLRTKEIKDSIVLVDEIEIGLHPDWQYQIVKDLEEWAPSNQYILATHSYEICSALTPAHVKEIEPKLVKSEAVSAH
jgi:predicted ATP-dependent endonuclease of OLD family